MTEATITVLNSDQRRFLDAQTQRAREAAQRAAEDALRALAVGEPSRPAYLSEEQNGLRLALRDKGRQLGDDTSRAGAPLTNLVHDVAYEQWHRLLFARFLEVNGLLRHAEYRDIPLSLEDCADFAPDLDEPDAWAVAARFASEILPGVFRLTDPAVQVRFAAEHRNALERLLLEIPAEVFTTEDALGWVYQFWQTAEKKRVNDSGVKIGGADLSPVTQLFTENYMVRFLLENSLGAWWVARHPESPLVASWEYLRHNDDGTPAAGSFSDWPERAADVTVMDPCCGSGHFLIALFGMLWRMRAEEEGITPAEAQDAVLRDNLHGLELDPRCTQIATFNIALEAWKQGGFRELPTPQVACSGVPIRASRAEWESLAGEDDELRKVMTHLHGLFRDADSLGSLIDPRPAIERDGGLFGRDLSVGVEWDKTRTLLSEALLAESGIPAVLGNAAEDVVNAAGMLGRDYVLVATNPPFLSASRQSEALKEFTKSVDGPASGNLAYTMWRRWSGCGTAFVLPQNWRFQVSYSTLRKEILRRGARHLVSALGVNGFSTSMWDFNTDLVISTPARVRSLAGIDAGRGASPTEVGDFLRQGPLVSVSADSQIENPDHRITLTSINRSALLAALATSSQGVTTGDNSQFIRKMWEIQLPHSEFRPIQSSVSGTAHFAGRDQLIWWQQEGAALIGNPQARIQGSAVWGKRGIAVSQMGSLPVTLYTGEIFDMNAAVVVPHDESDLPALWAYLSSAEYKRDVRAVDSKLNVTNATLVKVAFDRDRWQGAATQAGPLPQAYTDDPTQWLFNGHPVGSPQPLQVAVARVLGYRWPRQKPDELDQFADSDGIAALQSLPNEPDLATRLRELLLTAHGADWSSKFERKLVTDAGGKSGRLEDWLRDSFFAQHVKVFGNRPFLWHIWDGRKDGFSAFVNYHKLDRRTLEKLTFTSLGAWIDRQKHEARAERAGADARLGAAEDLQRRLKLILEGAPPYDIYVRWKPMAEQSIGWEPDFDDGVRLNIRPFVTADVLRSRVNVHWRKDRGTNPDGSERHNDLHPTLDERRVARKAAEAAE
ncbi:hypothetical protein [Herbiconiux flava]|uniref:Uncharacterized protein n=1 Tax=Herbiconiux flava TaxID=881268 RepID=A0A852SQ30_9MICO|nr:hypothetical protein [Herbiconiux flava]NYD70998.1 hypothetical protein [Herbiconiux flava]GLK19038.1 hypothetical protein GCM10017602_35200 [Herbiconiux flava]